MFHFLRERDKIMNEIKKLISLSGILALGYWIYFFIIDAMVPVWYTVDFWSEPMKILPITYAIITVIVLYNKKYIKKMIDIVIFAVAAILFHIVIYLFQCVFLYVDGFHTLYTFYSARNTVVISALVYMIVHMVTCHKREDKGE